MPVDDLRRGPGRSTRAIPGQERPGHTVTVAGVQHQLSVRQTFMFGRAES